MLPRSTTFTTSRNVLLFLLIWLISAVYMGMSLKRGWVPHDEGILAQAAERVLHGEMPHRDFNDPYTGGLSYLNASAFWIFGVNLLVLRWVLFVFFIAWVPAVYGAAREFCAPWRAAGTTLLAVAWSVPNYSAAMPSWFCLFFATFGTLSLLKYLRQPRTYLLILTGLCGGISFLAKSPGLFFVAGVSLFIVYREQSLAREGSSRPRRTPLYSAFVVLCLTAFCGALARLILPGGGISDFLYFVLPALAISVLLAMREFRHARIGDAARLKLLFSMAIPVLFSFGLPLLGLLALYWVHNATHELWTGLFVFHLQRLSYARLSPPHPILFLPSIILAFLLTEKEPSSGFRSFVSGLKILFAIFFLISCFFVRQIYIVVFEAAWCAIPVMTVAAVTLLSKRKEPHLLSDEQVVLLLSVTALCSLVQFPFPAPIYVCYVAPLTILTVAAVLSKVRRPVGINRSLVVIFLILFAVFLVRPGFLWHMGYGYYPDEQTVPLALPRAGNLRITRSDVVLYEELIPFVQQHATGAILAGPDCPEVYFLSGLTNPTRTFFDSFQDLASYQFDLERVIDRPNFLKVVIINSEPTFSSDRLPIIQSLVTSRFPESRKFGKFTVYWRP